eukprot:687143-Amphidinium_carterae.1
MQAVGCGLKISQHQCNFPREERGKDHRASCLQPRLQQGVSCGITAKKQGRLQPPATKDTRTIRKHL